MTQLRRSYDRGIAVITVRGHLGAQDLDVLRLFVDEALEKDASLIAVDLAGVATLDAGALAALVTAHHRTVQSGTALTLVAPRRPVLRLLERTRLDEVFPIVDVVPEIWAQYAS